jgi:hypothetical protein
MPATTPIRILLDRYLDLRARGEPVALEDLCRDAPEFLADLRREIAAMELHLCRSGRAHCPARPRSNQNRPANGCSRSGRG